MPRRRSKSPETPRKTDALRPLPSLQFMTFDQIRLRPVEPGDEVLLRRVYASTREEELRQAPWDDAMKEAFVRMQFDAQKSHYDRVYPECSNQVIEAAEGPAGRLYVDRSNKSVHIIDIAILAEFRNRGIGGCILRELLREAKESGVPATIHVERFNPAMRLYERLGFRKVKDAGEIYVLMEWRQEL